MGDVYMKVQADSAGAVQAFMVLTDAQKKAELGLMKIGIASQQTNQKLKETGGAGHGIGTALGSAADSAVRFMTSFGSLAAVVGLFFKWTSHLTKVRDLLIEMGNRSTTTQEKVLKLADQMGDTSEKGLTRAISNASDVAKAGGLRNIDEGAMILQSVMSNIDKPFAEQKKMAINIAKLSGKSGVTAEEAGVIPEFARAAGMAGNAEDLSQFLAELDRSLKVSASLGLGGFAEGSIKGTVGLLNLGMERREAFARMVQARAVSGGSDEQAANYLRRIGQSMAREEVREFIGKRAGKDYHDMSFQERFDTLGEAVLEAKTNKRTRKQLEGVLQPRESLLLPQFFGGGKEAYEVAKREVMAATPTVYQKQAADFLGSKLGKKRAEDVTTEQRQSLIGTEAHEESLLAQKAIEISKESPPTFGESMFMLGEGGRQRYIEKTLKGKPTFAGSEWLDKAITKVAGWEEFAAETVEKIGGKLLGGPGIMDMRPRIGASGEEMTAPITQSPATVNNYHGDQFFLGERQERDKPGELAPSTGVD